MPLLKLAWGVALCILLYVSLPCAAQSPAVPMNSMPEPPASTASNQAAAAKPKQTEPKVVPGERAKADAAELSALADQLRDQLKKMNVNVLSLDVIQKTEAIEKLAKKIKGEANAR